MRFKRGKVTELKTPITRTIPDDMEICYEHTSLTLERLQAEKHFWTTLNLLVKELPAYEEKQIHLTEFGAR